MKKDINWYDLDNQATIYPAVSDDSNTNVFRLACSLKEAVDPVILQQALDITMPQFQYYQMILRRGLFWFYLDNLSEKPIVKLETKRPCNKIFDIQEKKLLFNVTYFNRNINLEVFHALADGGGAFELLKTIVFKYLQISREEELTGKTPIIETRAVPESQAEDGFKRHYSQEKGKKSKSKKAFNISGSFLPSDQMQVITLRTSTKQMLALAKSKSVTISAYIAAAYMLSLSVYMDKRDASKDISVAVPVDLRGMFPSPTLRNFFSVIDVRYNFSTSSPNFDDILASVVKQLEEKINPENFNKVLNYNVWAQENIASRLIPLFIKNRVLKFIYKHEESHTTSTFSNVGKISMPAEMVPFIDSFDSLLNPTKVQRVKITLTSFEDALVINFTSNIAQTDIQKYFARFLSNNGIDITVTTNWSDTYETL